MATEAARLLVELLSKTGFPSRQSLVVVDCIAVASVAVAAVGIAVAALVVAVVLVVAADPILVVAVVAADADLPRQTYHQAFA